MALAAKYDFTIQQGATFQKRFRVLNVYLGIEDSGNIPRDLTEYSVRLQARQKRLSPTTYLDLNMSNGLTIPTPTNGIIIMDLTSQVTAALDFQCAVWDLELYQHDGGGHDLYVERLIEGEIKLSKEVTR